MKKWMEHKIPLVDGVRNGRRSSRKEKSYTNSQSIFATFAIHA